MNLKELLPIGSVVLLEGGEKRLMVFGVKQSQNAGEEYDYIGVLYPEGNIGEGGQYMFNHSDIKEVYFRGYEDGERDEFLDKLEKFYSTLND